MISRRTALALTALGLAATGTSGLTGLGAASAQQAGTIPDMTMGDESAPVKVIEYASYTCPHCADFHSETFGAFKRDYIDTGKVFFTYREVYFDRYGLWASMVARCGGPETYFGISDILYDEQGQWARQSDPAAVAESLKKIGAQAGLPADRIEACLKDGEQAQALISWFEDNAARDGIQSTPSFLIGDEVHSGNMSLAQIGALIDDAG